MSDLKFSKITETPIPSPTRKNPTDAGIDLYANLLDFTLIGRLSIHANEYEIVHTGFTVEIPENCFGWITNKSRNNFLIGGGIIDQGYQGELLVKIINPTKDTITIHHGDAIAQLIIVPTTFLGLRIVDSGDIHQNKTDRGNDGGIIRQII